MNQNKGGLQRLQQLIKLQYMRSYASCETKKTQNYHQMLPKLKITAQQSKTSATSQFICSQSDIKGIVGQAISFYSNNSLAIKHKPKNAFQNSIKQIININFRNKNKKQQRQQVQTTANVDSSNTRNNKQKSQICQSHRKTRYYAFQRLVKMNSESYGAYKNWLMEKRKISPLITTTTKKNSANLRSMSKKKTLNSYESVEEINPFNSSQSQSDLIQNEQRELQKLLRKDIKIYSKHKKYIINNKNQTLQQLYVTRTNLIKKINLSNQLSSKRATNIKYNFPKNKQYKFYLGPGNNHEIIKKVLKQTRSLNWIQTTQYDTLFNLKWQQYTDKSAYSKLQFTRYKQLINHLQFHQYISTKAGLVQTLRQYSVKTSHSFDVFQTIPVTFTFDWSDKNKFEEQLKKFIYYFCQNHPDVQRSLKMQRDFVEVIRNLWKGQKIPPNMSFDKNILRRLNIPALSPVFKIEQSQYLWIIKPSDYNRGRGIKIFSTLQQMCEIIKQDIPSDSFVIQKYIESPMLLKQRKFDIRVWVLVSPQGQPFIFSQGYIRTSCEQFSLNQKNNNYIHLTNNAVQKNSCKYGMYEQGNQLTFDDIDKTMQKQQGYFKRVWLPQIKRICTLVFEASLGKITGEEKLKHNLNSSFIKQTYRLRVKNNQVITSANNQPFVVNTKNQCPPILNSSTGRSNVQNKNISKKSTFQLFGFDFMIDSQEKVWLIQVNTNPCLETSSKILQVLIPRMIDDAFKIVLDPIFKVNVKLEKTTYQVEGYDSSQNMWIPLFKH